MTAMLVEVHLGIWAALSWQSNKEVPTCCKGTLTGHQPDVGAAPSVLLRHSLGLCERAAATFVTRLQGSLIERRGPSSQLQRAWKGLRKNRQQHSLLSNAPSVNDCKYENENGTN